MQKAETFLPHISLFYVDFTVFPDVDYPHPSWLLTCFQAENSSTKAHLKPATVHSDEQAL